MPKILSGLPLRSMPPALGATSRGPWRHRSSPEGSLVQFTYFVAPPLDEDGGLPAA